MSSGDQGTRRRPRVAIDAGQGATFVELFFDLVFVFAITQLTSTVLHDLTWSGVGRAALLFWLVWWAWTQFTWTLNLSDTTHAFVRVPVLAATAVAFFLAQSVPDAFTTAGGWFASSYVLVRVIGMGLQEWTYGGDERDTQSLTLFIGISFVGLALVLAGGFGPEGLRALFWGLAVVADIAAAGFAGQGEWEIAAGHFVERHGLIVIIALGESLIAAGIATSELERDTLFALTAAGAVVATCTLWWTYFGWAHDALEEAMADTGADQRGAFARDTFSLWHAVIVAGVIGIAVGFEEAIAHPDHVLETNAALALTVGAAMFVGGLGGALRRAGVPVSGTPRLVFLAALVAAPFVIPQVAPGVVLWGLAAAAMALGLAERPSSA